MPSQVTVKQKYRIDLTAAVIAATTFLAHVMANRETTYSNYNGEQWKNIHNLSLSLKDAVAMIQFNILNPGFTSMKDREVSALNAIQRYLVACGVQGYALKHADVVS